MNARFSQKFISPLKLKDMCDALGISLFPHEEVLPARGTFKQGTEQVSLLANGVPSECLDAQIDQIGDVGDSSLSMICD